MDQLKNIWRQNRETILTIFIAFNIIAIVIGCTRVIRIPSEARNIFLPYLRWTRLAQSWYLFAPEPKREAVRYRVKITFKDQTSKDWYRPYPDNWGFFSRHEAYQYQKFDLGSNPLMKDEDARKDYCAYVMRLHWSEENPPETVTLYREFAPWPDPTNGKPLSFDESKLRYKNYLVATYQVENGRLQ